MIEKLPFLKKPLAVLLWISVAWICPTELLAQGKTITGIVADEDGIGLPGVSIVLKDNPSLGTVTDFEGNYRLAIPQKHENGALLFSFIGYISQEVPIGNKSVINVDLEPDVQSLKEVEVVSDGYTTIKRTDLTGSVASITSEELSRVPVASAAEAMTGRLPGVNVMTTDGSPGAEIVIRVRGGGSVTQDNSPLYVVDGFIVNSIRDIPPTDIETMNVLKDAAATAIYGAQGANGVVVITTKNAKAGKTTVSYNGFAQFKQLPPNRRLEVLSPYEFVMAQYEYAKLRSEADLRRFERYFGKYDDLELYRQRPGTDWQDELFGDPIASQYHNLSVSGGTDKTKMRLSLTNNNDEGLMLNSGYRRNAINFKLDHEISNALKLDISTRITNTVVDGAGTSGGSQIRVKDAITTRPVNGIVDDLDIDMTIVDSEDDLQSFLLSLIDPRELAEQDWRKRTTNSYVMNAGLSWAIINGLNFRSTFTTETSFDERLRFYGPLTSMSFNEGSSLPLGSMDDAQRSSYRWLNTLGYSLDDLGDAHKLNFLVGQEIYTNTGKSSYVRAKEFRESMTPEEMFANIGLGNTDISTTYQSTPQNRFSLFGRANYSLLDKYILTATFRADASSKFSKENRVGFFPALALAWKLNEEGFLNGVSAIQDLKLRVSYGETGNDRIPANSTVFLFKPDLFRGPGFGSNQSNPYYVGDGNTLFNPDLKWETTISRNVGLDFTLFNARIMGSLDAYYNTTNDLLLQQAISPVSGYRYQYNNIGSTSNRGLELGLNAYLIEKEDYSLSANVNFGLNRGRIDALDGTEERFYASNWASTSLRDQMDYRLTTGGTVGDIYGYVNDGMYTVDDFQQIEGGYILKEGVADNKGVLGVSQLRPGYMKLKDLNGDGEINSDDRQVIGNATPKAQGGFGLSATFKGFDANAFFNWSYGNKIYNTGRIEFNQYYRQSYGNMLSSMHSDKRFTYIDVDGTYTGIPGEEVTDLQQLSEMNEGKERWSHNGFGGATVVLTDDAIEDGSFLRLNTLSIGYSLPQSLLSKAKLSQFRVYVTGYNLWLWSRYSGFDPEVSTTRSSSYSALTPGVDYSAYPRSRSLTMGVNVTF